MLAAWTDAVAAAPVSFLAGLGVGFWIGGRYVIRRHFDEGPPTRRLGDEP